MYYADRAIKSLPVGGIFGKCDGVSAHLRLQLTSLLLSYLGEIHAVPPFSFLMCVPRRFSAAKNFTYATEAEPLHFYLKHLHLQPQQRALY